MESSTLILSQRRISRLVAFCLVYEFEDVLQKVTDAERIDVANFADINFSRRAYKLLRKTTGSVQLAGKLAPRPREKTALQKDYDLFFASFSNAYELYSIQTIPEWRERCAKAVCFITEAWPHLLPEYLIELLSRFDHVFLGVGSAVDEFARITGRPCSYLPLAADVLRFAPISFDQPRPVDICGIGRRSDITHKALLEQAEKHGIFYYFDTVVASGSNRADRTFQVDDPQEHRQMLANILKRSRFYLANRSHVNNPQITAEHDAISARFYEGAAAGTIMVGEPPRTELFEEQFDWPDATIDVPFDSTIIVDRLAELYGDEHRMREIAAGNVRGAASKHDWLHRINVIFDTVGIAPTDSMLARAQLLDELASRN